MMAPINDYDKDDDIDNEDGDEGLDRMLLPKVIIIMKMMMMMMTILTELLAAMLMLIMIKAITGW